MTQVLQKKLSKVCIEITITDCSQLIIVVDSFLVEIQNLGQEEDAPAPEPFEWDPNDE